MTTPVTGEIEARRFMHADIAEFEDQFGSDILFKSQEIVDGIGGPQLGFETISMDTIMVAMMLVGAHVSPALDRASGDGVRAQTIEECALKAERHYGISRDGVDIAAKIRALSAVSIPRVEVEKPLIDSITACFHDFDLDALGKTNALRLARAIAKVVSQPLHPAGGWRLVPVEPTLEMLIHGASAWSGAHKNTPDKALVRKLWTEMLAALPAPPASDKETR